MFLLTKQNNCSILNITNICSKRRNIMKLKKSFVLYHDYWNWFRLLTDEELGKLIRAIFYYEREQTEPYDLNEKTIIAFYMVKDTLDRDRAKYEAVCNRNKENARIRWQKMKDCGIELPPEATDQLQ